MTVIIENKKTKVTQMCNNADIIKICEKNPDEYEITPIESSTLIEEDLNYTADEHIDEVVEEDTAVTPTNDEKPTTKSKKGAKN